MSTRTVSTSSERHSYHDNPRLDVVKYLNNALNGEVGDVLELGGGSGAFASQFCQLMHPMRYVIVDVVKHRQDNAVIEDIQGDAAEFVCKGGPQEFDLIIMNDFFEHIVAGQDFMSGLISILKDDGMIFISAPNLGNAGSIYSLIKGDFEYTKVGVLDETHVRFFTPKSLVRFFSRYGFVAEKIEPQSRFSPNYPPMKSIISRFLAKLGIFWLEHQFFCVFRKTGTQKDVS